MVATQKLTSHEIRKKFLEFFKKKNHEVVESSSLIPQNDPTLLFTNAGMVQFKDVFLGKDPRPYTRAATSQKCVRAGGKHNDLENVGFTARHHTFFEMLGNFSFGDYFKQEAIQFAWEFVTQELKLPKDKLYVTVFEKDDEAAKIWNEQEKVPLDRIFRFGEKDNFWSMGDTGPCGPCTELFIDRGEKYGCGKPTCKMGCDCDRFMEFWNLVFMQYNRDASGNLTPLPKPSVDTGAGLERIASIIQEVETNYDTDGFQQIIQKTAALSGKAYNSFTNLPEQQAINVSFRVVADHSRATAFLISDGVMPSNEGRGYVLRRIMRRAIRHGKKLGFEGAFLNKTVGFVIEQMGSIYPDLLEKKLFIERAVLAEEEQFLKTLERGLSLLDEECAKVKNNTLSGEVAFKLYDTFGFPVDLTRVICAEKGLSVDEAGFDTAMEKQKSESRKHWKGSGQEALDAHYYELAAKLLAEKKLPEFVGYEELQAHGVCLAYWKQKNSEVVEAVFSKTPFYGESGGQEGDKGRISAAGFEAEVVDVQKPIPDVIVAHLKILKGDLKVGQTYLQETNAKLRALTARNHTATHLLHWALRDVLGKHVKQAGSLVTSELLRFDFNHFQGLTPEELMLIERKINEKIWYGSKVLKQEMSKEDAISAGAIAFFGEKYGEKVRVISVGDFSVELCGGTHVDHSSDIHLFKVVSESGIAAGVRRMIAYTSERAFQYLNEKSNQVDILRENLKANSSEEVVPRVEKMILQEKELRRQIESFQAKEAGAEVESIFARVKGIPDSNLFFSICKPDTLGMKKLRELCDLIKQREANSVVVLVMKDPEQEKILLVSAIGPSAPKKYSAQIIIQKLAPIVGGKGGGKSDFAQAGGTVTSGLGQLETELMNVLLGVS